jgi:hypothetical protein
MTPQKPMTRLLLVHSPLAGPASWDLIAPTWPKPAGRSPSPT